VKVAPGPSAAGLGNEAELAVYDRLMRLLTHDIQNSMA